jgi:exodeoxyribonuclease-3
MPKIATWNINSVRLRSALVQRFLKEEAPDVLCLQEIKVEEGLFPRQIFEEMGYPHLAVHGQKGYHGVATASRVPFETTEKAWFCGKTDARHVCTQVGEVEIHNVYIPSGGDVPDPEANEKFAHKLAFIDELGAWLKKRKRKDTGKLVLLGDFNVAPLEHDVWSHKQMLKVVSHTPVEVERLSGLQASRAFVDVTREEKAEPEKVYTWWSYRARDWRASNRGRRLDHIWVTPALGGAAHTVSIHADARGWDGPSDHVPVTMEIDAF